MYRITLLFLLFLIIPDAYIYFVHILRKKQNPWLRLAYWLPTLLLAAGYFILMYATGENAMAHHTYGVGKLGIGIFLFVIPKALFMFFSLI